MVGLAGSPYCNRITHRRFGAWGPPGTLTFPIQEAVPENLIYFYCDVRDILSYSLDPLHQPSCWLEPGEKKQIDPENLMSPSGDTQGCL